MEADALRSLGELETAAEVAGELLTLARRQGLVREEGLALRMLGQIAHDNGAYQNARMLLLRSVAVLDANGMELEATRGRTLLADLPAAAESAPAGR